MSLWNKEQLLPIADLLLAAAHADRETAEVETDAARAILSKLAGDPLPAEISSRIAGFAPSSFELASSAKALGALSAAQRRELLTFIAQITESDDVHDLDESEFIVRVARAIGASPAEYQGLTIELTASAPPPVPKG